MDEYFDFVYGLARQILRVLALTLDLNEDWFEEFADDAITITRLLHYPSQPVDADGLARGIGAHTDFGAVTLLMQGEVSGLQVWDRETDSWVDVSSVCLQVLTDETNGAARLHPSRMRMWSTLETYNESPPHYI